MKNLLLSAVLIAATVRTNYAQTYQNDYQKIISTARSGMVNYTLCETKDGGYAMVSFLEADDKFAQNRIQIFKTNADFKVIQSQRFLFNPTTMNTFEITPFDIYETTTNDFIIAGGIINEGDPEYSGGFLLSIKNVGNKNFEMGWMQIYPNNDTPTQMAVKDLRRVVAVHDGFMAIGPGRDNANVSCGIVLKTNLKGEIQWSQHFYGTEYKGNKNSILADMVRINEEEVAIVGSVNGFPVDDADINVIRLRTNGEIVSNHVYEFSNEAKEPKFTYLERGAAIEYNPKKNELIVAGTVIKKVRGVCVAAEFKEILTFGISLKNGDVKWSTRHDIGADKTYATESFFCSDIDFGNDDYAVSGTVQNRLNTKMTHYNGFILRLNKDFLAKDVRFYGGDQQDFLSRIYYKKNSYVSAGMFNKSGTNVNWMIESFNSIKSDCLSKRAEVPTADHKMHVLEGMSEKIEIAQNPTEIKLEKTIYEESNLCEKQLAKATFQQASETKALE